MLTNVGLSAIRASRLDVAESTFRQVLARDSQVRDIWTGRALSGLGEVCFERGELVDALRLNQEALVIYRDIGNRVDEGEAVLTIAQILYRQGRSEESAEQLRLAMDISQEVGVFIVQGLCLELLAEFRNDQNDLTGAAEALTEAYDLLAERDAELAQRVRGRLDALTDSLAARSPSRLKR